ncbi:MAG: YraN family protein [Spirochaetaceae bacterium]|nr:MAG: YraN family protein [Spirochaetaceae bacterium]
MTAQRSTTTRGRDGETRAAAFLVDLGWNIVQKNFRGRRGEVDIVAVREGIIGFFEVKSWTVLPYESLEHSVTRRKLARIVGASREFLAVNSEFDGFSPRYEVLFVCGDRVEQIPGVVE